MITLPPLLRVLAAFDGREVSALESLARALRRDGLLSASRPGKGSSFVSVTDATSILIATLAAAGPADAPPTTQLFRALKPEPLPVPTSMLGPLARRIAATANFGAALEVLIDHFADHPNSVLACEVSTSRPRPVATIAIQDERLGLVLRLRWEGDAPVRHPGAGYAKATTTTMASTGIIGLASLLKGGASNKEKSSEAA